QELQYQADSEASFPPSANFLDLSRRIELKQYFCSIVGTHRGLIDTLESTLLEYPNGACVRYRNERMKWPVAFVIFQEFRERRARDASSPVASPHPVSNQTPVVLFPAAHVARHLTVDEDGSHQVGRVSENVVPPVRHERVPVPGWKRRH